MGTKSQPGKYDCYGKAAADEPLFILLARDPLAADIIRLWTALRAHHFAAADVLLDDMTIYARDLPREDLDKLAEAYQCADAMDGWFETRLENPASAVRPHETPAAVLP